MNPNLPATLQGLQIPDALRQLYAPQQNKDLSAGVMSVPVLSIRGKVFRLKYQGQETDLIDQQGYPLPYLDVILLKSSPRFSKIFYPAAYQEGSDEAPLCFSLDGVVPDPSAQQKQSHTCAACPHNVWGSKTTPQGTQTKACADGRRMAIVPAGIPMNEQFGGAMLLRVPPASLQDLASYGNQLAASNIPYFAVVTRLSFAQDKAFPKMNFSFSGPLNEVQTKAVHYWLAGGGQDSVENLLQSAETPVVAPVAQQAPPPPVTPSVYAGPPQPQAFAPAPPPPPQPQFNPYLQPSQPVANPQYAPPPVQPQFNPQPQHPFVTAPPTHLTAPAASPQVYAPPPPQVMAPPPVSQPQVMATPPASPVPSQPEAPKRGRGRPRAAIAIPQAAPQAPMQDQGGPPTTGVAQPAATPSMPTGFAPQPVAQPATAASPSSAPMQQPPQQMVLPMPQAQPGGHSPIAQGNGQAPPAVSAAPADLDEMLDRALGVAG